MNKSPLNKSKAIACLLLTCLFLAQSCRKDSFKHSLPNPSSTSQQLIKYEVIDEWLHTNPVASQLQLDWTKAKQTVIKGKNVVIVPVLQLLPVVKQNINGIKAATISSNKISGKSSSTNISAQNEEAAHQFYLKHPPKIYFIQGDDKNKLYTYLLSFTPKDYNSEAGENRIWTGKLNEYNFKGDTIAVQEFDKSKLIDRYLLKQEAPEGATVYEKIKGEKLQSLTGLNDRKTGNIFYWLLNKVESFVGWVGSAFGASYWANAQVYGGVNYGSGWRISDINWSSIFDSSGNTTQIDHIAAPDYASAGGAVYESFYGYADPNSEVVYPHGPNVAIQNFVADYVAGTFQLDYDSRLFLYAHLDIAEEIRKYGAINPVGQEQIDFIKWAVGYQIENPDVLFKELIDNNELNITLPNLDASELNNYPKFKALVNDLPNFIANYPNILKALSLTTGLTEKRIKELMQPGKGPKVIVINNLKDADGNDVVGQFDNKNKILKIDNGYVNDLDAANTPTKYQAIGLILTITTLHEFVHFGRDANNLPKRMAGVVTGKGSYEAGWYFEDIITAPGSNRLEPANAQEWLRYYRVKSRQ